MEKLRHVIAQIPMQPAKESMDVPQELSIWALQVKQKMPWCEEQQPLEGSLERKDCIFLQAHSKELHFFIFPMRPK